MASVPIAVSVNTCKRAPSGILKLAALLHSADVHHEANEARLMVLHSCGGPSRWFLDLLPATAARRPAFPPRCGQGILAGVLGLSAPSILGAFG